MKNNIIKPVFIIGNPRSGTTLLRLLLHSNSALIVPPEAGFAFWLYDEFYNYQPDSLDIFLCKMKNTKKMSNWRLNWDHLRETLIKQSPKNYAELINCIYLFYAKSIGKKVHRWGDKNNFYLNYIIKIKNLYPNAYFIHIIRDGRNIACSYRSINRKNLNSLNAPKFPYNIEDIAYEWNKNITTIRNSFNTFEYKTVHEIKYEELVADPIKVINQIVRFIDIEFENSMLEYTMLDENEGGEPKEYLKWKYKNTLPIIQELPNKYETELTRGEIKKFNQIAQSNLKKYSYL